MFKLGKRKDIANTNTSVVLYSEAGVPLTVFDTEIITNYRRMINTLLYQGTIPSKLALASALKGEGATYSSLALATTMASDLAVNICVVELNWWSPGLAHQLTQATRPPKQRWHKPVEMPEVAIPTSLGVSGVLAEQVSIDEAVISTNLPNLKLLPAGELPQSQRAGVARSPMLKALVEELANRFDHIIIDVPALITTSDGMALASLADGVCLVARQGITPTNFVKQALDEVKHLSVLGVVLNQTKINMPRWAYNLIPQE